MLNDVELRLYDKLPSSWSEWEKPQHVLPLLGTRSILEKGMKSSPILQVNYSPILKCDTLFEGVLRAKVSYFREYFFVT